MNETVDRRILGAFQFVDGITGDVIEQPLAVVSSGWTIEPNRRGVYVIFDGPGLRGLTAQFEPLPGSWPAVTPFEISVSDPSGAYLPRRASITNAPAIAPALQSVTLYPAPAAASALNWSVIHASVVNAVTSAGLPWAVLQVTTNAANTLVATGMSDARGEALLAVPALKPQIVANGTTFATVTTPATVKAYYDPAFSGQAATWVPNPDDVLSNLSNTALKSATQAAQLATGAIASLSIAIAV